MSRSKNTSGCIQFILMRTNLVCFFAITNKLRLRYNALSPEDTTAVKQKEYIKLCTNSLRATGSCINKITTVIKADLTALNGTDCTQFLNWLLSLEDILQNQHDAVSNVSHFLQIKPNRFGSGENATRIAHRADLTSSCPVNRVMSNNGLNVIDRHLKKQC